MECFYQMSQNRSLPYCWWYPGLVDFPPVLTIFFFTDVCLLFVLKCGGGLDLFQSDRPFYSVGT